MPAWTCPADSPRLSSLLCSNQDLQLQAQTQEFVQNKLNQPISASRERLNRARHVPIAQAPVLLERTALLQLERFYI